MTASVLRAVMRKAAPGVKTIELDRLAERLIREKGGTPLFKGYRGYPGTLCVSVNAEVVHGMPGERELKDGDIVSVDVGVRLDAWCGDAALTWPVGEIPPSTQRLLDVTKGALEEALSVIRPEIRLSVVCGAIQDYVETRGFSVVRQFTGHGIGREMHEDPQIPNFVASGMADPVLRPGMTLAIEPMVNAGGSEVKVLNNGWTVVTGDGSLSAHVEHTVAVDENGADILTR